MAGVSETGANGKRKRGGAGFVICACPAVSSGLVELSSAGYRKLGAIEYRLNL